MTPRVRRFALLVLGLTAYAAFTVLLPMYIWKPLMLVIMVALLLGICWQLAALPFPWRLPWRRR